MRTIKIAILTILISVKLGLAAEPPPEFYRVWPQGVFSDGMKNAADRYEKYCLIGEYLCYEKKSSCLGQCCYSPNRKEENAWGHYVSWRCETYDPNDQPPDGKSGR